MGQVTIYLDAEVEQKVRAAAKSQNMSLSRWISSLLREKTADEWPASIRQLVGAWRTFPTAEEIRSGEGTDIPRVPF